MTKQRLDHTRQIEYCLHQSEVTLLSYVNRLASFLGVTGVLLKEFSDYMLGLSRRIKHTSE